MPLEQIATHLSGAPDESGDFQTSLRSLAEDITRQIEELQALRQWVLDLASTRGQRRRKPGSPRCAGTDYSVTPARMRS